MKVLIFIVLKVVEIAAIVFGPYYLGKFVHSWTGGFCMHSLSPPQCCPFYVIGLGSLFFAFVAIVIVVLIGALCMANWALVGKIHSKLKGNQNENRIK